MPRTSPTPEVCAAPFGFSGNADGAVSPGFGARQGAMFIGRLGGRSLDQALAGKIASGKLRKNHGTSSFLMGISKISQRVLKFWEVYIDEGNLGKYLQANYPISMASFNSYVKLPEGMWGNSMILFFSTIVKIGYQSVSVYQHVIINLISMVSVHHRQRASLDHWRAYLNRGRPKLCMVFLNRKHLFECVFLARTWRNHHFRGKALGESEKSEQMLYPIGSMYGIYAAIIWGILMVNVTIYSIHGSYGYS